MTEFNLSIAVEDGNVHDEFTTEGFHLVDCCSA
jgi:hypothetical protein